MVECVCQVRQVQQQQHQQQGEFGVSESFSTFIWFEELRTTEGAADSRLVANEEAECFGGKSYI